MRRFAVKFIYSFPFHPLFSYTHLYRYRKKPDINIYIFHLQLIISGRCIGNIAYVKKRLSEVYLYVFFFLRMKKCVCANFGVSSPLRENFRREISASLAPPLFSPYTSFIRIFELFTP